LEDFSSWHTVSTQEIQDERIDLHIFTVFYNKDFYTFFFNKKELEKYIKYKLIDNANLYHFYFQEKNEYAEIREQEYNVSKYCDRWMLISEII
jgi:hypothetical protein